LIASDCAREIAGMPSSSAEPAAPFINARRETGFSMMSSQTLFGRGAAACRLC
jgi:hypothetical protein